MEHSYNLSSTGINACVQSEKEEEIDQAKTGSKVFLPLLGVVVRVSFRKILWWWIRMQ